MILDLIQHPNAICRITENERRVEVCPFVSMQDMRRGLKQIVEKKNVFHETSALEEQQQDNSNNKITSTLLWIRHLRAQRSAGLYPGNYRLWEIIPNVLRLCCQIELNDSEITSSRGAACTVGDKVASEPLPLNDILEVKAGSMEVVWPLVVP
eukprot:scaffold5013_cov318-Alexandrium_tamarense.AAC.2